MESYLNSAEFAALLKVKVETIHMKSHKGTLPIPVYKCGRHLLFKESDATAYMESLYIAPANNNLAVQGTIDSKITNIHDVVIGKRIMTKQAKSHGNRIRTR